MAGGEDFNMAEEFAAADFHEERLEKRFRRTMETLAKDPGKSILASSAYNPVMCRSFLFSIYAIPL
ncbi:MAG: hypothetical protein Pg6C_16370 [Treponemataceae bacterium]|nr:MAG: hypothetical protein Pg6C_16370 [Treponemataceae bacterium]